MSKYTIGADPELFVFDGANGQFISAHDLVPGSKREPYIVHDGAVQPDGVPAEFNTAPANSADEFIGNMSSVIGQLEAIVRGASPSYHLVPVPTAEFDPEYFATLPDEARLLGCEPDFNAYTGKMNTPPNPDVTFRTGAGHVHVGIGEPMWDTSPFEDDFQEIRKRVKQLDATLYPMSLQWDQDRKRQELYGAKGAFRPKFYGFEYRSLSNAYVGDSVITGWIYDTTVQAMELFDEGIYLYETGFDMTSISDRQAYGFRGWHYVGEDQMFAGISYA